jgi:CBS domain-containing protein
MWRLRRLSVSKSVRDLMHPGLITCRKDTTLGQVAAMLVQHHVHALIVEDRDRRPLGVVTDFDLLAGEWLSTDDESLSAMRGMTAGELMTTPVDSIEAGETMEAAAKRMRDGNVHRLMVTERGKAVGIISISDIVASIAGHSTVLRGNVSDVMSKPILTCREEVRASDIARTMTEMHSRSVLVVDASGRPTGVVTKFDLLACCIATEGESPTAADIMNPPVTIHPTASLREAADTMIAHHYHRLVVVDPEQPEAFPVGIISSYDIVSEMARPGSVWMS